MTGEEFREWRLKKGWSQVKASRELDVTPTTISRWETGYYQVPGPVANLIEMLEGQSE